MANFGDFPSSENSSNDKPEPPSWERKVLQDLAFAAIKEQRTSRRWGYVFKGLVLLYLVAVFSVATSDIQIEDYQQPHTALVDINGVIAPDSDVNADIIVSAIRQAFDSDHAKGLILRMNTPGGSPVQSGIINDEIKRLQSKREDFPIYAVIQDVCASGGYYIAVAADEIYADKASIVGSIGVRMDGFGFTETIEKLGIERRSLTAGKHKAFLDPFSPMKSFDVEHAQSMLDTIHQQFIDVVKSGRGNRLVDDENLFSGLFWSGEQAVELGLIDGLANTSTVARDIVGAKDIIDYTPRPDYLDRFTDEFGASFQQYLGDLFSLRVH